MLRILIVLSVFSMVASDSFAAERKPNIVFVMADDLGIGDLGCYGQARIQTPHIDGMAADGVRFTQYYGGSTVCAPSRCVLMTGLNLGHCYIRGNSKDSLRAEDVTLAELLQQAGYRCGMFGKWGLGQEASAGLPSKQGFDEFVGYLDQHHAHNYYPAFLIHNDQRLPLPNVVPGNDPYGSGVASEKLKYSHDVIFDAAMKFLTDSHQQPFFLYMPITLPHANNEAKKAGMEIPSYGQYSNRDWPEPEKGFAAMVSRIDDDMGTLFQKLQDLQLDENTIVFFTSDNGPHREGGRDPAFFSSNGSLRGIKRDMYEGGIRVPMIVRWPGKTHPGTTSELIAYHGDVLATCCDIVGIPVPEGLDSISFLPTILGNDSLQAEHPFLYWEFYERGFKQAVRQGDWKYVRVNHSRELYHLRDDPGEKHDIARTHPEKLAELEAIAEHEHVPNPLWQVKIPPRKD